jgi:hypothetical protein
MPPGIGYGNKGPAMVSGQMGTVNNGQEMAGIMPAMKAKKMRRKRPKTGEVAAVAAFKKQMR